MYATPCRDRRLRRAIALFALVAIGGTVAATVSPHPDTGTREARTIFLVDTPSGINRFVQAARRIRSEEVRRGEEPTEWIFRTTRQAEEAGRDSLDHWLRNADAALVRLAVGELHQTVGSALDGVSDGPPVFWAYHVPTALLRRSRHHSLRFLEGFDESELTQLGGGELTLAEDAPASLRAWRKGLAYVDGKGVGNAQHLLTLLSDVAERGPEEAVANADPVEEPPPFERYPLAEPDTSLPPTAPAVGILDFDSYAANSEAEIIDALAAELRSRGVRPVPVVAGWGAPTVDAIRQHFMDEDRAEVQAVISLQSFVLGGDAAREEADSLLTEMDVPVLRAIRLGDLDPGEWALSAEGIPWAAVYHQVALPELQGMIEPLVVAAESPATVDPLTGARRAVYEPIPDQVALLGERLERWISLRDTPSERKRVALVYYNHPPGKQNIGADNLNVTETLVRLLELLKDDGYDLGEAETARWTRTPDSLVSRLLQVGTNTGSYGPGEVRRLVDEGAYLLPDTMYTRWFEDLPRLVRREVVDGPLGYVEALLADWKVGEAKETELLRNELETVFAQMREFFVAFPPSGPERTQGPAALDEVERTAYDLLEGTGPLERFRAAKERFLALGIEALSGWGPPPGDVMRVEKDGTDHLVIPGLHVGNVFLGPQPERGFHADPEKVHSSTLVAPTHQYLAFYAYLAREFGADALVHVGRHSSYEWLPRKQVGLSRADHPIAVLHGLPSIYLYTVDGVGEGLQAKRRGLATIVDHLTPPLKATELYGDLLQLQALHDGFHAQKAPGRRAAIARQIRERLTEERFGDLRREIERENGGTPVVDMEAEHLVHEVGHELGAVRETMIPYGLHSFAVPWSAEEIEMLSESMIALQIDSTTARAEQERDSARSAIEGALRSSFRDEGEAFLRALSGRRIEPGNGNDPIRSPEVLPTGRNFHGIDPSLIPTRPAMELGRVLAEESLARLRREHDDSTYVPDRVSAVLWAVETARDEGATVGFALYLMGIAPEWDARGKVTGLRVLPVDSLGRPRVDVTAVTSGLFRDLFPPALHLVDRGARLALAASARLLAERDPLLLIALKAALVDVEEEAWGREPLTQNPVARHWLEEVREDDLEDDAAAVGRRAMTRVFGPAPGSYGVGINYLVGQPWLWEDRGEVADHYLRRMGYAYGADASGSATGAAGFARKLEGVDASFHSRSSNLYGVADNDDFFDYFGGLSMAAERVNGAAPQSYVLHSADPRNVEVEGLETFLGRELRSRYYNPEWIEGQMAEGYDGARTISNKFVEFLWGWQVTNPDIVRDWMWDEIDDVYMTDKHELGVDAWLSEGERSYALQNVAAILLTAAQRGFWSTDEARLRRIAEDLGRQVVETSVGCSSHVCGNEEAMTYASELMDPALRQRFRRALEEIREPSDDVERTVDTPPASTPPAPEAETPTADASEASEPPRSEPDPRPAEAEQPTDVEEPTDDAPPSDESTSAEVYEITVQEEESGGENPARNWLGKALGLLLLGAFGGGILRGYRSFAPGRADRARSGKRVTNTTRRT